MKACCLYTEEKKTLLLLLLRLLFPAAYSGLFCLLRMTLCSLNRCASRSPRGHVYPEARFCASHLFFFLNSQNFNKKKK